MKKSIQLRQGDVFLETVTVSAEARAKWKPLQPAKERWTVARGEVTGHAHTIEAGSAILYRSGRARYLEVPERCQLRHEEHGAIDLEAGIYRLRRQREYTPEKPRFVLD